jgi:hypothetical protein
MIDNRDPEEVGTQLLRIAEQTRKRFGADISLSEIADMYGQSIGNVEAGDTLTERSASYNGHGNAKRLSQSESRGEGVVESDDS